MREPVDNLGSSFLSDASQQRPYANQSRYQVGLGPFALGTACGRVVFRATTYAQARRDQSC